MKEVELDNGLLKVKILNYGAILHSLQLTKPDGSIQELIKGCPTTEDYLTDSAYRGACIGRVAGRISNNGFSLNGTHYPLHTENGIHLHGGANGFSKKTWQIESVEEGNNPSVTLFRESAHGEEGYPGNLKVWVSYTLVDQQLVITHKATTDAPTLVNLTNHAYFQLDDSPQIDHYELILNATQQVALGEDLLPNGQLLAVGELDNDFTTPRPIKTKRFDSIFALDEGNIAGSAFSPKSGIRMELSTDQKALVIYTKPGDGSICFEAQGFPNAVHNPHFPQWTIQPGDTYHHQMTFRFDCLS
ncbi:aldose epimerase family protein [Sediminicola luteus]|nr:aldose epimerase family protein [Sediminicola luteus]